MARRNLRNSSLASDWCEWDPSTVGMDSVVEMRMGKVLLPKVPSLFLTAVGHAYLSLQNKMEHKRLMEMVSHRSMAGSSADSLFWSIVWFPRLSCSFTYWVIPCLEESHSDAPYHKVQEPS